MATIFKTPGGKWRAQVRRHQIYATKIFFRKGDAEKWARETETQIDRGESVLGGGSKKLRSFADIIDVHIADMHEVGKPLRRSKAYALDLLKRRLGHLPIREVDRQRVVNYGRGRALEGAGPATVAAEISYIKTMITHAAAVHGVSVSSEQVDLARVALSRLGVVGRSKERNRRPREEELERLFVHFDNWKRLTIPMSRIVKFAIASAMRESEITIITWRDLDSRRRTVLVKDRKDPRNKEGNDQLVPLTDLSGYDAMALIEGKGLLRSVIVRRYFPAIPDLWGQHFDELAKIVILKICAFTT